MTRASPTTVLDKGQKTGMLEVGRASGGSKGVRGEGEDDSLQPAASSEQRGKRRSNAEALMTKRLAEAAGSGESLSLNGSAMSNVRECPGLSVLKFVTMRDCRRASSISLMSL